MSMPTPPRNTQTETGTHNTHPARATVDGRVEREEHQGPSYNLGEWFWVDLKRWGSDEQVSHLLCLTKVGSNFFELREPSSQHGGSAIVRLHHDEADDKLTYEPEPESVIQGYLAHHQGRVQKLMADVQELTARLGVAPHHTLGHSSEGVGRVNKALSVMSDKTDIKAYEDELVKAQKEDLPELFKQIEKEQAQVARWMSAETLPLQAQADTLKNSLSEIDNRIFNVSLYAGLTERVTHVAEGDPAPMGTKLHVMQRRLYMDEECLLNYRSGGMEFRDIREFDAWLTQPENLNRIMPFPRCIVAMKVRRIRKERHSDGRLLTAFINFNLENADKSTFLYIRNGDNVYCLESDQDFGELIFPDKASFDPAEPVMVRMFANRVASIITLREYEDRLKATKDREAKYKQWKRENPIEQWREGKRLAFLDKWNAASEDYRDRNAPLEEWLKSRMREASEHRYEFDNPYRMEAFGDRIDERDWGPFDKSNLHYDTIAETVRSKILEYNRIALIIQGLYDRSEVLHPHGPVKTWEPTSFAQNIELVYDGSALLNHGEAPDIDAYVALCNESISPDSVTVGQEGFWLEREAEKEKARRERSWREEPRDVPSYFRPFGNEGPGYLARVESWKPRAGKATFSWYRERLRGSGYIGDQAGDDIRTTITVPLERLFNCDAYQPGDYKQFFCDPRTRSQYLKWAPMLLAAEEYHAGKMKPQEPVPKD